MYTYYLVWTQDETSIVASPSDCGESHFVMKFVNNTNQIWNVHIGNIYCHYSVRQPVNNVNNLIFREGIPSTGSKPNAVITAKDVTMHEHYGGVLVYSPKVVIRET